MFMILCSCSMSTFASTVGARAILIEELGESAHLCSYVITLQLQRSMQYGSSR